MKALQIEELQFEYPQHKGTETSFSLEIRIMVLWVDLDIKTEQMF